MLEIKGTVRGKIAEAIVQHQRVVGDNFVTDVSSTIDTILSIPELAIVDREAKLPSVNHNWRPLGTEMSLDDIFDSGQTMAQETMVDMGWIKEVTDSK